MFISETNKEFKDMNISNNRTIDRAAKALIKEGWTYRQSKGGHVVLKDPKTGFSLPLLFLLLAIEPRKIGFQL